MSGRPEGRQKHVTGNSKGVARRGQGLGTGKVGNSRPGMGSGGSGGERSGGDRGGGGGLLKIIFLLIALLVGGGGGISLLGDQDSSYDSSAYTSGYDTAGSVSSGWSRESNAGRLNADVAAGAREKRTVLKGNGQDTITIMVYMCGTDLESRSGMASSDLVEMTKADFDPEKVRILVYTGGCKSWQNNTVSNKVNQIYQVKNGGVACIKENAGTGSMTDPNTLSEFISFCDANYPADRKELILWDHGGGSVSGYGYDEKNAKSGSMDLAKISQALKKTGVKFDFVGFDACLMATLENALMLEGYADYLIASEETEPGVGWYYTNWLTDLSENTSTPTIEIGKKIADDFVRECERSCRGQKTTLSVIDLAELKATVPEKFNAFAASVSDTIENDNYKTVSDARYDAREFAQSSKIDQVDLVDFAVNTKVKEGEKLADAILGAVKYNKTSSNMTNAYGLSIYFPYRKMQNVDDAVSTYEQIGMDEEYSQCIKKFASVEAVGQSQSTMTIPSSAAGSLLGSLLGGEFAGGGQGSAIDLTDLLFMAEGLIDNRSMEQYVEENQFDVEKLVWTQEGGKHLLKLSEEQWGMVHDLALNVFYDDGEGYVDLGLDNTFEFDEDGNLIGDTDGTWIAVNGQPVAYYYENTVRDGEDYTITGYIPAMLNDQLVHLLVVFDQDHPNGYLSGARAVYSEGETETVAKADTKLQVGDQIDFICDYYSYDGTYEDSYYLGEPMMVEEDMEISNVDVSEGTLSVMYRFTDIYNNQYWTEEIVE